jgi:uncharacterized LabA/DUF88 family protein
MAFIDGQNLYHHARAAFNCTHPNYDVQKLARAVCAAEPNWYVRQVYFYTGVHSPTGDPLWHHFWTHKLRAMKNAGVHVFKRDIRYRKRTHKLADGTELTFDVAEEKGIDVRIAIDVIRATLAGTLDVALLFTQDQDLSEVADEVRKIAELQGRTIQVCSAYPMSPTASNRRGVNSTHWMPFDQALYDSCIDPRDYRPKVAGATP